VRNLSRLWIFAVLALSVGVSNSAQAQNRAATTQALQALMGGGTGRVSQAFDNQTLFLGADLQHTTNIFLEADLGGPFVDCQIGGRVSDPALCGENANGVRPYTILEKSNDGEANESNVTAIVGEGRVSRIRRNYKLRGEGSLRALRDTETDTLRLLPDLTASGRFYAGDPRLFFDVNGYAGAIQQAAGAGVVINENGNLDRRRTLTRIYAGPSALLPIGRTLGLQAGYRRFDLRVIDEGDRATGDFWNVGGVAFTSSEAGRLELNYSRDETRRENADGEASRNAFIDRDSFTADGGYFLSRNLEAQVELGYDEVSTSRLDEDNLEGFFWAAGGSLRTNDLQLTALYGDRFGGEYVQGQLLYNFRRRLIISGEALRTTRFRLGAGSDLATDQFDTLIGIYDLFGGVASGDFFVDDGGIIAPPTYQPGDYLIGGLAPLRDFAGALDDDSERGSEGLAVVDRYRASAIATVARAQIGVSGVVTTLDFGTVSTDVASARVFASAPIGRKVSVSASVSASQSERQFCTVPSDVSGFCVIEVELPDIDPELLALIGDLDDVLDFRRTVETGTYGGRLRVSYRPNRDWTGFLEVGYSANENLNATARRTQPGAEFEETFVTIGFRRRIAR